MKRQLDTYVGRGVLAINSTDGVTEWEVVLEGGIHAINKDPNNTPPTIPNPTGLKFTTVIISEAYTEMVLNIFDANGQLMGTEWKVPFTNNQFLIWDQVSNQTW